MSICSFHYVVYSRLPFKTQRPRRVYLAPPGSRLRKNRCLTVEVPGGGEQLACWCRPSHKQGDFLTYLVLLADTQLVTRSNVRTTKDPLFPNRTQRPNPSDGDTRVAASKPVVSSIKDYYKEPVHLPTFSPDELLGMTIVKDDGGEFIRAKVVRKIMDHDAENHDQIKFLLALGDGQLEELISNNELSDLVTELMATKESGQQDVASYSEILDHQGPLKAHDPRYKGSSYNVIQFPPEMDENWVRYGLAKLGQISRTKLAEDAVLCVHNTASALNR